MANQDVSILDYTQGLQQYAIGAQWFVDNSIIIDNLDIRKNGEGANEPALDPNAKHFEPFEIQFLKDEKEIRAQSDKPGGNFYMYLPREQSLRTLIPFRTGFKEGTSQVVFWKKKNVQAAISPDGFVQIPSDRAGKIFLYITYSGDGIVCFEADKPDDKLILRSVLICELNAPPPGFAAKTWDFKKNMSQNYTGTYEITYDPTTNSVGTNFQGVSEAQENIAAAMRVKKVIFNANNRPQRNQVDWDVEKVEPGKILCYVIRCKENQEGIIENTSRYYNSIADIVADQKALHGKEYIFPVLQTDEFGNITVDYRKMAFISLWG